MKKRVLCCLMVVALLLAQMVTVSAAPSKGADFDVTTDGDVVENTDEEMPELPDGKKPVTDVKKLTNNKEEKVTFFVPNLTDDLLDGLGVYYTINGTDWIFVEPSSVDLENQTVTFELPLGEMYFVLVSNGEVLVDAAVGTAPKTGVSSTWMVWVLAAMVLAAAAVVLGKKRTA